MMSLMSRMSSNNFYLDDVFDDFMFTKAKDYGRMNCDIYEKDNIYYLEIDIPGVDKSDIRMEINNSDYLMVIVERNVDKSNELEDKNYIRKERCYGKYQRSFYIGGVDKEQIEATYVNGILKVKMPKKAEDKSFNQIIEIK